MTLRQMAIVALILVWPFGSALASSPNPALANLADNTAMDLGSFPCTTPLGDLNGCEKVTDYSGFVYDQNNHQMLMFGGGHATSFTDALFSFNPDTLTWSEKYQPTPCVTMTPLNYDEVNTAWKSGPSGPYPRPISRHTYDLLAVADGIPEFILLMWPNGDGNSCPVGSVGNFIYARAKSKIAHFNLNTNTWSFSATAYGDGEPDATDQYGSAEYDPISKKIIIFGRYGLWTYDPVTKVKTQAISSTWGGDIGYANQLVYYPPNQKMYYFSRNTDTVYEITLNRTNFSQSTMTKVVTSGSYPQHGEPGYAYDSVNQIIGGAVDNNSFNVFDPKTKAWTSKTIQGGSPGSMAFHALAYDRVNNVFVFLTTARKTWAYRYKISSDLTAPAAPTGLQVK